MSRRPPICVFGHLLYGLLVGAIALFAASISESSATAAIIALAFTIGSWVLDFALAGQPGALEWISRLSLTQTLRTFEQGLLSIGLLLGVVAAIGGFAALSAVWLHPGVPLRTKFMRSIACVAAVAVVLASGHAGQDIGGPHRGSAQLVSGRRSAGARRASRAAAHHRSPGAGRPALRRSASQRSGQARAGRFHDVTIRLATTGQSVVGSSSDEAYGEIEYSYAGRADKSRSTSPREILPLLYALAGRPVPPPGAGEEYSGLPAWSPTPRPALPVVLRRPSAADRPRVVVESAARRESRPTHQRRRSTMNMIKSTIGTAAACVGARRIAVVCRRGASR